MPPVDGAYAWRWYQGAQVPLAFGSDFPVEIVNPFWGIYAAITRQDAEGKPPGGWHPEQRLSLEEALRGFITSSRWGLQPMGSDRVCAVKRCWSSVGAIPTRQLGRSSR
jgi:Amidohydrolase family